jgi:aspartate/methionine/tyrosine aminotransferase
MVQRWISQRARQVDASGIRRIFDLGATLKDPIDLSIGQPDLEVPPAVRQAAVEAIEQGKNGYTPTQGIELLRQRLLEQVRRRYPDPDRDLLITSGTTGGLVLAILALVDPGDEVVIFDPYFVMYPHLVRMAGGVPVTVDTDDEFRVDLNRVESVLTPRTKGIILNSPANPTGAVLSCEELQGLADLARRHDLFLISDEVYRSFCYVESFHSPAEWYDRTLVIDGFSKGYSITGWRLGYAYGPRELIGEMAKLQQFTYVCAPHPFQWAGLAALEVDVGPRVEQFRRRRAFLIQELSDCYEIRRSEGAFYLFPRCPWGTGTSFVEHAIGQGLLIIPGCVFSRRDTHFRLSYAASEETLQRGVEVLRRLARGR